MKVAYIIDSLDGIHGGTERQLYNLIRGMLDRGHQVSLYVLRDTEFTSDLNDFPCPVHSLEIQSVLRPSSLRSLWRFRRSLCNAKVQVIHGFFNDVALILPPLMLGTGIRTFTSRRDMGIWYSRASLWLLRLYRVTPAQIICNSQAVARHTQEYEKAAPDALRVIYNGLEMGDLAPELNSECSWVADLAVGPGAVNVVLLANVRAVKRIEDLVMAAGLLRKSGWRFKFHIVGSLQEPGYYQMLARLIEQQGVTEDFNFAGKVDNPRSRLPKFDIGVLTSASEGLSNTVIEYMAAGLPSVISDVGGNPELITDGQEGLLYPAGEVATLANCLLRLGEDEDFRQSIAANARLKSKLYGLDKMVTEHEKGYLELI